MRLPPAWFDGLAEARRGLWRSAAESFAAAANRAPVDPRPPLAHALCLLELGEIDDALVLLETTAALREAGPEWRTPITWLQAAARLAAGDPLAAERLADDLPTALRRRVAAAVLLRAGQWPAGVAALLSGRRPDRLLR